MNGISRKLEGTEESVGEWDHKAWEITQSAHQGEKKMEINE